MIHLPLPLLLARRRRRRRLVSLIALPMPNPLLPPLPVPGPILYTCLAAYYIRITGTERWHIRFRTVLARAALGPWVHPLPPGRGTARQPPQRGRDGIRSARRETLAVPCEMVEQRSCRPSFSMLPKTSAAGSPQLRVHALLREPALHLSVGLTPASVRHAPE